MPDRNRLGDKVRSVRETRKLSQEDLAGRAEMKPELLRQIEAGELVPSLAPLIKIARVLGVRLGTFLDDQETLGPVVTRAGAYPTVVRFSDKDHPGHSDLDFFSLAADKSSRHMEPFIIDLHASSAQNAHLSAHEGEEFIYVVAGEIEINYGTLVYLMKPGDSIYYDSIVAHNVHAAGGNPARILAVVYAPV